MSIKNLQLEFFYENMLFTKLKISLYVFSYPEINPSNLEQFFRKSREIKGIKERIEKIETQRKNYKDKKDTNRTDILNSTIKDLLRTLNKALIVFDIDDNTWVKISSTIRLF